MLISSVILILREVLEAALIVSVLLALDQPGKKARWLWGALLVGVLGAALYAAQLNVISEWFDYVGQEIINAALQITIYVGLSFVVYDRYCKPDALQKSGLSEFVMALCVTCAVVREGTEVLIYYSAFSQNTDFIFSVVLGGLIGAAIGVSLGAVFFYGIRSRKRNTQRNMSVILLAFVASNMLAQATLLLTQADWLPSYAPLWDTSAWLTEESTIGQLLYALIGYEATPSIIQVIAYSAGFVLIMLAARIGKQKANKANRRHSFFG